MISFKKKYSTQGVKKIADYSAINESFIAVYLKIFKQCEIVQTCIRLSAKVAAYILKHSRAHFKMPNVCSARS